MPSGNDWVAFPFGWLDDVVIFGDEVDGLGECGESFCGGWYEDGRDGDGADH